MGWIIDVCIFVWLWAAHVNQREGGINESPSYLGICAKTVPAQLRGTMMSLTGPYGQRDWMANL